ncbi:unnamed protein product [Tilletia controversa]|nr:unnamed protein product [Tilletia controversa]CAD6941766.1 unnamed protein product [Tilletia controversa]CAD6949028.1 unnamed protein product [Tilletia controversa]CAD6978753.1 unnamed protein product [Tilletia controversa]
MKVVGLLSGGKDSCYNLCHCVRQGHEIVALATLAPPAGKDEIDSYMYQTVGHDAVHLVAQALGVPLYRRSITGQPVNQEMQYRRKDSPGDADHSAAQDETEDLLDLLLEVKNNHPDVEGVSVGAILSNYQRIRVEHVSLRPELQLTPLTYLWQRSQDDLLAEMVDAGVNAVLIKVAGIGLDERDLGKSLAQMQPKLRKLNANYGAHICGEGGEYETLTLDCPLFKNRIELVETEVVTHAEAAFASVAYLRVIKANLVAKSNDAPSMDSIHIPAGLDALGLRTLEAVAAASEADCSPNATLASIAQTTYSGASASSRPHLHHSGNWYHVSNVNGATSEGMVPETIEEETAAMFKKLKATLEEAQLTLQHVTHVNLYLVSQADFARVNAVYKTIFQEAPPSRACVGTRVRKGDLVRVALDAVAVDDWNERRCLHVQGRGYWAPANIGPYSQAMLARERISIAGQIGLRPADLSLPIEDFDLQCALSLQHARRIHVAVLEGAGLQPADADAAVEGGVCWIENVDVDDASSAKLACRIAKARAAWSTQPSSSDPEHNSDGGNSDDEQFSDDEDPRTRTQQNEITPWLAGDGRQAKATDLPMLYVVVPFQGLPRGAGIEWQLTACTGRSAAVASSTLEDEDDDEDSPSWGLSKSSHIQRGEINITVEGTRRLRLVWHTFTSVKSQSSVGIMTVQQYRSGLPSSAQDSKTEDGDLSALRKQVGAALSIRVFVTARGAEAESGESSVFDLAMKLLQEGTTTLEPRAMPVWVDALFAQHDSSGSGDLERIEHTTQDDPSNLSDITAPIEAAFVWNSVTNIM